MRQRQTVVRFNENIYKWLKEQAEQKSCSKNDVLRQLILEKMKLSNEKSKREINN